MVPTPSTQQETTTIVYAGSMPTGSGPRTGISSIFTLYKVCRLAVSSKTQTAQPCGWQGTLIYRLAICTKLMSLTIWAKVNHHWKHRTRGLYMSIMTKDPPRKITKTRNNYNKQLVACIWLSMLLARRDTKATQIEWFGPCNGRYKFEIDILVLVNMSNMNWLITSNDEIKVPKRCNRNGWLGEGRKKDHCQSNWDICLSSALVWSEIVTLAYMIEPSIYQSWLTRCHCCYQYVGWYVPYR
jgi:hypothetical protein